MLKENIALEEAQELLFANCPKVGKKLWNLSNSYGRILYEDIKATENIPPFARSPYDGYAMRSEDTLGATEYNPVTFEVIEEIPAGYAPVKEIISGKAAKILTGAPIPQGADCVIKYEDTKEEESRFSISYPLKAGENIVPAGEDVELGTVIATKGTMITPPLMGLMAALGISEVPIYKRPRIAIVSTGDELIGPTEPLTPGKIRNSNCYTLMGYIQSIGAEPIVIGTAKDKQEDVAALIEEGLQRADMVITTGGVSVGDYDVVKAAVRIVGAETLYWKIEIKPGSSTLAAVKDGKMILGLSGNPAAAMVIFQLLVVPYIKKMAGRADYLNQIVEVVLKKDFKKASPRRRFLRGKLVIEGGSLFLESTGGQGNGVLRSMLGCNVLAEIPGGSGSIQAGQKLTAHLVN